MNRTCLIGESDPFIARLLHRFGAQYGLETTRVTSGHDLLAAARRVRPSVIILDVEMPGLVRGWEVVRMLQADAELSNIPVISCSWMPALDDSPQAREFAGYLMKPDLHYADFVTALLGAGIPAAGPAAEVELPVQDPVSTSSKEVQQSEPE